MSQQSSCGADTRVRVHHLGAMYRTSLQDYSLAMVEKQPGSHLAGFPPCFGVGHPSDETREPRANSCLDLWANSKADWIASTRLDLAGQSVLEAEVLLWRVEHQRLPLAVSS